MGAPPVRKAQASDVDALATTLARAFDDDPLTTWLFPNDATRPRKLPSFFRALLRASLPLGEVYATDDQRCAAIWNPPGTFPMGWRTDARLGLNTARLVGPRIVTRSRGLLYIEGHHPKERHWYLQMLGTDPDHQEPRRRIGDPRPDPRAMRPERGTRLSRIVERTEHPVLRAARVRSQRGDPRARRPRVVGHVAGATRSLTLRFRAPESRNSEGCEPSRDSCRTRPTRGGRAPLR